MTQPAEPRRRRRRWTAAAVAATLAGIAPAQPPAGMPPPQLVEPSAGGVRVAEDGLVANWYAQPGERASAVPAVLLLGGSEGGLGAGAARQAAGFAVLQLAYFGAPGLPSKLDLVPLETFDRALAWLGRQPGVDPARVAVVGASKGAEAALLIASRHPELHAVVAGAPSAAVWPGIDLSGGETHSSWTVAAKPMPYLRYGTAGSSIFGGYSAGLAALPAHPEAAIPVARITAKLLLVCGRADALWPSCPMAEQVQRAMRGRATVLEYDAAGHALFGPPVPTGSAGYQGLGALGGTAEGNNRARADAWPRVLAFLAN